MTIGKYELQPLFAEPFFRVDLSEAITEEQILYVQALEMVQNRGNLISENLYIFEEPELSGIHDAVQEALDVYARDVMGITQRLYVTQSWSLVNHPGVGMHGHSHSNSLISGSLYYCELPDPPARMIFDRHTSYQFLELPPEEDKRSLYNTPMNVLTPKTGELFLFSSRLQHVIEANSADTPRYAIAFNTFIRGKIGSYRDVSELELK